MALTLRAKLAGTWLMISFGLVAEAMNGVMSEEVPLWLLSVLVSNMIITAITVFRLQKAGEM